MAKGATALSDRRKSRTGPYKNDRRSGGDRRAKLRRKADKEAYNMSKRALAAAQEAIDKSNENGAALSNHLVVCENQGRTVIDRLDRQDKILWWIVSSALIGAVTAVGGLVMFIFEHLAPHVG